MAWASADTKNGIITLATEDEGTFFHELGHIADQKASPKEYENAKPTTIQNGRIHQDELKEAVAELTSCTLARMYGLNIDGRAWQYLAHYSDKKPEAISRLCDKVLKRTEKAIRLILDTANQLEKPLEAAPIAA